MCYGRRPSDEEEERRRGASPNRRQLTVESIAILTLRLRLAETQARLARARAREAELSRRLAEMKRFVAVMDIMEGFLKRRYREQQEDVVRFQSSIPGKRREER